MNVFLVADGDEGRRAVDLIERTGLEQSVILSLRMYWPFELDDLQHPLVGKWADYGVKEIDFGYSSTASTGFVVEALEHFAETTGQDVLREPSIQMWVAMSLGREVMAPLRVFHRFLAETRPRSLWMSAASQKNMPLLLALAHAHAVPRKTLP